jgi:Zn-dependent protease with chaperone function
MRPLRALLSFAVLFLIMTATVSSAMALPRVSLRTPAIAQTPASRASPSSPQDGAPSPATAETVKHVTHYTLPPALYRKAHRLGQISFWGELVGTVYSWLILLLILNWRLAPKYRDWAEKTSRARFLQALIFAPPLVLTIGVLTIPLDIAQHWVSRRFGISIQGWGSWLWDWTKAEIVLIVISTFLIWILYTAIRKSPRRWWFYFWLVSLPLMAFLVFVQPLVIDPMFHKFEPLAQKDSALTASLEQLVQHAGQNIPPSRMFWMGAGAKTTALNAYVTGIGASKRIVVWDTTIRDMDAPQIVFVVGHEMGHYALNHIWKGLAFAAVGLFVLFYLGFRTIGWLLGRGGGRNPDLRAPSQTLQPTPNWELRGVNDWASLPALLLLVSVFSFIGMPIGSAFSRHVEHQADQYGLEVTHGLTPDSSQVAAQSFQILGQEDLADPAPNPVDVFLFYSHPPIPDRIRFALRYDPWAAGGQGAFVK